MLEIFEQALEHLVTISKFALEAFSVICIVVGFIKTLQLAYQLNRQRTPIPSFNKIRLRFGMWLALALEFQLGADILATTIAPTLESLGKLGLLALIRTFLNYFLSKELEAELELEKEQSKSAEKALFSSS
ncbi:MAG: DUF1622 domain-containing protein [Snowella sp.]|nr:DUF1622 domain-containing protein [Snowella sp.]